MKAMPIALVLVLGLALVTGCGKKIDDSKVLVTVNGTAITEKEYEEYLGARQLQQQPIPDKEKERQVVLDEMINRLVLAQRAEKQKLDEQPDVHFQLKRQRENILARAMLRKHLNETPITDEEVEKRYQQEVEKTHKTEYRARHILLKSEEEARDVIRRVQKGANFAALAKARSTDVRSGREGGDLGWFNQGQMIPDFFNAVMKLKKGEITSEPVKTEFGWHVIKVEDMRPLRTPPLEDVKGGIRQLVQQERIDRLVKDLREEAKIKINE